MMPDRSASAGAADAALFDRLIPVVIEAGGAILRARDGHAVAAKADRSPVTDADRIAEAIVIRALREAAPTVPIVAEEEVAEGRIPAVAGDFFLVDALDGTRDFIAGGNDFTVNIGLIRNGRPIAGIVHAPAVRRVWVGLVGKGARRIDIGRDPRGRPIVVRTARPGALDIVASRSHRSPETDAFIARFPGSRIVAAGSSLKLVTIAEGGADLYPRLAPTSQWDIAAGDAILAAAGGRVLDMTGRRLGYGPRHDGGAHPFLNPWFVATGGIDPFAPTGA